MTSGVDVSEEVLILYKKMKREEAGEDPLEKCKFCLFVIDGNCIVPETTSKVFQKDLQGESDVFKYIMSKVPETECRYALYDCSYHTTLSENNDLIFIMWIPNNSSVREKMKYASSQDGIRKRFVELGIKHTWELKNVADLKDPMYFVDKLGGRSVVKQLEGKDC